MAPAVIFLPHHRRDTLMRGTGQPGAGEFPPDWDISTVTAAVLAVASDPDRVTWDDPAAWPGAEIAGQPCWRAQGTTGAVPITVALSAGGEILAARPGRRPGTPGCSVQVTAGLSRVPGSAKGPRRDRR